MTNREIAEQLNISPSALSIVINNKRGVSDATRQRVLKALHDMGQENLIKPESSAVQTKSLCFIVYKRTGDILDTHPFFLLLLENFEMRARMHGYNMVFSTVDKRHSLEEQILHLNSLGAEGGLIFATEMLEEDYQIFGRYNAPFVVMDNYFSYLPINTVAIDNEMGTFQAVQYLYENGHRSIGYLKSASSISSFEERDDGYHKAMEQFSIPLKEEFIYTVRYTEEGARQDFNHLLNSKPKLPTAFVTDDDTIAAGVMRALKEHGYAIPEDISIVGYNNRPLCTEIRPHLSSIDVPKTSFVNEAVDELVSLIETKTDSPGKRRTRKIRIGTNLVERDSVKRL